MGTNTIWRPGLLAVAMAAAILLAFAGRPAAPSAATTVTVTFPATEDTYFKDTRPSRNYGQAARLEADSAPSVKRILLRFHVTGIPEESSVASARLRLFVVGRSRQAGEVRTVNGAWSEDSTTWLNAPSLGDRIADLPGPAVAGTWKEADVTSVVTSNGDVDLYVVTSSKDGVDYASAESRSNGPELVVQWAGELPAPTSTLTPTTAPIPSLTPTPTPTPTVSAPTAGTTYYVDSITGNDSNSGSTEDQAWRSLSRASSAALAPGDRLLLRRGGTWTGTLSLSQSGTAASPISIGSYGSGEAPVIQGGSNCVNLSGSHLVVRELHLDNCSWAGIKIASGASLNTVERNVVTRNAAGIQVSAGASDNRILHNVLEDNNRMSVLTISPSSDDSGAFGILLNGDRNEVAYNSISGSDAFSYDYGRDGSAVEVYGGQSNSIHHNLAVDNHSFSELGNSRARDNTFAYNAVRSSLAESRFVVTRGAGSSYGPVLNTRLHNNTVDLTGSGSQGFVCHAGCADDILSMRNNIIQAAWKVGYADASFDEDYDLFFGGQLQFVAGPHSTVADPSFASPEAGDLHLRPNSPAVDRAVDLGYGNDLDGSLVPQDGDGDGSRVPDMGAFEVPGAAEPAPESTPTPTPTGTASATHTPTATQTPATSPTATGTPGIEVLTFTPTDDAYVQLNLPDSNFGSAASLEVDDSPKKDFLLTFSVSGVGSRYVSQASIRLANIDASRLGGDFHRVADTTWSEGTVTWDNAPAGEPGVLASLGSVTPGNTYDIDVTSAVTGDGAVSFRVTSSSSDGADYSSKESANAPRLIVVTSDAPQSEPTGTPTPTPTPTVETPPSPTATPIPTATPTGTLPPPAAAVTASAETEPVPHGGDAADDPAIWLHPSDPSLSVIIGTDKLGGLAVYDLAGTQLHYYDGIKPNNVDLRYGFSLGGQSVDLVAASERDSDTILLYRLEAADRGLVSVRAAARDTGLGVAGLCMYHSPATGKFYVFVGDSSGTVLQFEVFDTGVGTVDYRLARRIRFGSTTEGCVADDEAQTLYVAEEDVAIWRLGAEPGSGTAGTQVALVGDHLTADIEGLAIYPYGDGAGYLLASSQGSDDFAIFDRLTYAYLGRFSVHDGTVDGVDHTDGIEVVGSALGPAFPGGVFVAQDNSNGGANQNFKLVSWKAIADALGLR